MQYVEQNGRLVITIPLSAYPEGLTYITSAVNLAGELNHHPDILYTCNTLRIELTTHDAGSTVTEKDRNYMKLFMERNA